MMAAQISPLLKSLPDGRQGGVPWPRHECQGEGVRSPKYVVELNVKTKNKI